MNQKPQVFLVEFFVVIYFGSLLIYFCVYAIFPLWLPWGLHKHPTVITIYIKLIKFQLHIEALLPERSVHDTTNYIFIYCVAINRFIIILSFIF